MAKVLGPLLSLAASGKVGAGHLFKCQEKWQQFTMYKGWIIRQTARSKLSQEKKNPAFFNQQRLFKIAANNVKVMSDEDRELWKEFSKNFKSRHDCTYSESYITYSDIAISFALISLLGIGGKAPARPSQISDTAKRAWEVAQFNKRASKGFWLQLINPVPGF